ncbi:MAG TPA: hypothetical protein VL400_05410 [Polyangiaceae bacterium]|jgi:hypothetical protein|nr:hypothetical protein [Polyangiaceae bacterium]
MFGSSLVKSVVLAAVVSAFVPAVAMADDTAGQARHGERAHEKREQAKFPMAAAEFKQKAEARITKFRGKLEKVLEKRGATAEQKKAALAKFDAGAEKVRAAVEVAAKDGTVTKEEAKDVRKVAKEARGDMGKHKGHGKGHGKGKGKQGNASDA